MEGNTQANVSYKGEGRRSRQSLEVAQVCPQRLPVALPSRRTGATCSSSWQGWGRGPAGAQGQDSSKRQGAEDGGRAFPTAGWVVHSSVR